MQVREESANSEGFWELASGIDALYLSGRTTIPGELAARLQAIRAEGDDTGGRIPLVLGGVEFEVAPHGWGKYRYCLKHRNGQIGLTPSKSLPAIRIQPRAEFLHGVGPEVVVGWFRNVLERELQFVRLTVSRVDIYADFQGWRLEVDDRYRFVSRAKDLATYEESEEFNGLQFGKRGSQTVSARIYDKTVESAKKGSAYWRDIWGTRYVDGLPVLRIEFEIGRQALRQYGLDTPEEVLEASGALWASLTSGWLSYRVGADDQTKARWPVAPEWEQVCRARVADGAFGIERMYAGKRRGDLHKLAPGLVGYLSNFAALTGHESFEETFDQLGRFVWWYGKVTGQTFKERTAEKQRRYALP